MQLIVLADSGCRRYVHAVAQYANHIIIRLGEAPGVWNKPLHCKVPDPLLREGVARETNLYLCYLTHHSGTPKIKFVT